MSETEETNQDRDRDRDRDRVRDPDNDPPYSRVFVVCGKSATEEELEPEFRALGNLQYLRVVRDKQTMESKGVAYAKYDKASSAALAIEHLNSKKLSEDGVALKVMIADAKGSSSTSRYQSKEPEDNPPRSRLFVVCSKDFTEDDLIEKFKVYGDLEYCKLIKDKNTLESKGFAYVKYYKSSHAAIATEEVSHTVEPGVKLKALVADPKSKSRSSDISYPPPVSYNPYDMGPMGGYPMPYAPIPRQRLFVVCHKSVTQDQLARLFSRFPGMEYCDLKKNKQTDESKGFAYVNYSTPQAALMAKEQLDGIDFPHSSGSILKVMFAEPLGVKGSQSSEHSSMSSSGGGGRPSSHSHQTSSPMQLRDSFANMLSYPPPPAMGYPPGPSHIPSHSHMVAPMSPTGEKSNDRNYPEGSRLFIVLSKALPDYVLQDIFSRFGALEYVRLQKDKNYGYAKYTTSSAAQYAMQYLNNTDIHGQRIRIQLANPPNNDSRKRQRTSN